MTLEEMANEVKEAMKKGFCEEKRNAITNYCIGYKKQGCPETCYYAKQNGKKIPASTIGTN